VNRISSANYICPIGLHVKWEFFKIQPERRKTLPFLFQKTLESAGITGFVFLSHDDAVEAGAVGLVLLVLRSALWRSGILVITIPGAKELSYSQR
jgi:hypothetical protein